MNFELYLKHAPAASFFFLAIVITFVGQYFQPKLMEKLGFNAYLIRTKKEYHRFLTSMLVHANFMHFLFNILSYYFFAFALEMLFLGTVKFVIILLVSQIVAQLYDYFRWKNNPNFWSVGASGAISGLIFSYIAIRPTATIFLFFIPMPAWIFGILFVAYSAYAGRSYAGGINHFAHLFGAIAGFVLTILLRPDVLNTWLSFIM